MFEQDQERPLSQQHKPFAYTLNYRNANATLTLVSGYVALHKTCYIYFVNQQLFKPGN